MTKNVLVVGGTGFVGSAIIAQLRIMGHHVVVGARRLRQARARFPFAKCFQCDYNTDGDVAFWEKQLKDHQVEVVVNCVGIFQGGLTQSIRSVHTDTPIALFTAAQNLKLKGVVQMSALGAGEVASPYAQTKAKADDFLLAQNEIPFVVFRPSVIYSSSASGGTALFRGLASLPFIIPLVGRGNVKMAPLYLNDLSHAIVDIISNNQFSNAVVNACGPEVVTQKQMLVSLRSWLGFSKACTIPIPLPIIKIGAFFGSFIQSAPLNRTAIKMLEKDSVADGSAFYQLLSFPVRGFTAVLETLPSSAQDRWHARLYFLRPLFKLLLAMLWTLIGGLFYWFYKSENDFIWSYLLSPLHLDSPVITLGGMGISIALSLIAILLTPRALWLMLQLLGAASFLGLFISGIPAVTAVAGFMCLSLLTLILIVWAIGDPR